MNDRWHTLLAAYQTAQISDADFAEFEELLRTSAEARASFHRASRLDENLRQEAEKLESESVPEATKVVKMPHWSRRTFGSIPRGLVAGAALFLVSVVAYAITTQPRIIATLVSSEHAAWESELPTVPGAALTKGHLKLVSGIATIRFDSDVDVTIEGPISMTMKKQSLVFLGDGNAAIDSTEASESFTAITPYGHLYAEKARLTIQSGRADAEARIALSEGQLLVKLRSTGEVEKFVAPASVTLTEESIVSKNSLEREPAVQERKNAVRLGTDGKTVTIIRNNGTVKWTRPDRLTLRQSMKESGFDQRALLWFDLSKVDVESLQHPRLLFNLVHSFSGLASRLPRENRFSVYGFSVGEGEQWSGTFKWDDAPLPNEAAKVGDFSISRSQPTGLITIEGSALESFVDDNRGREVFFLVLRETSYIEGEGPGLAHAIASDFHPEAAGPILEFSSKK